MHVEMTACYFVRMMPYWRNVVFAGHNDISEITKNIDEDDIEENKNVNPIIPHLKRWFVKKENAELM
jgi:hypothetical protein